MTWNTVNVPGISCQWATQAHCGYFLWENSRCPHELPNWDIAVTWLGTLWMSWGCPVLGTLQWNWPGKFWMGFWCTGWVFGGYFVHFLAMSLQCTWWEHHPLPPVIVGKRFSHSYFLLPSSLLPCSLTFLPKPFSLSPGLVSQMVGFQTQGKETMADDDPLIKPKWSWLLWALCLQFGPPLQLATGWGQICW